MSSVAAPVDALKRRISFAEGRKGRILETLLATYPKPISAKQLMGRSGFSYHAQPVGSFISLCCEFSSINQFLVPYGWHVARDGGRPDDLVRLEPTEAIQARRAGAE